jgi:hypothetical protein
MRSYWYRITFDYALATGVVNHEAAPAISVGNSLLVFGSTKKGKGD